jgi:hemerythrin superfamily protein
MAAKKKQIDAITLLKDDHKKVKALLTAITETEAPARREKLLGQIEVELKAHAKIEEEIFYPAFKRKADESEEKQMFFEAKEEHGLIDVILPKTKAADPDGELFAGRATVLKDIVFHHAKEEEKEMFKAAKKMFEREELQTLGAEMQKRKRELVRELKSGK